MQLRFLQLPLEQVVFPYLSAASLGCLACTCCTLQTLVFGLDATVWHRAGKAVLGAAHPVFQDSSREASANEVRRALQQYSPVHQNLCGQLISGGPCSRQQLETQELGSCKDVSESW